jgi:hypothetical protein
MSPSNLYIKNSKSEIVDFFLLCSAVPPLPTSPHRFTYIYLFLFIFSLFNYKTIILPVVLYGCETWSLIWKENRLRVLKNRVLRRIFGPKRDEVTGEWRKLHIEELHICTPPQILLGRSNQGE